MGKNTESPTPYKNVVQIIVLIAILSRADSVKIPERTRISKIQQIPQYQFHYYLNDNKDENNKSQVEYKIKENNHNSFGIADPRDDVKTVNYRTEKSNGLQSDSNIGELPYQISLNNPQLHSQQNYTNKELKASEALPIVVEPIKYAQDQKSLKSDKEDSINEFQPTDNITNVSQLIEQRNTNQTEDRNDDIKDEQAADQIVIQDEDTAITETEFTIPFKKPNLVNANDFKYINEEAMKQNIVNKVIQNINGNHDSQLNFKSALSDKPLKIVDVESIETEQGNYQSSHDHSNVKSQQLSNKPLRLFGYNPSLASSLYDMQVHNNRPSQIQQPPNLFNQGYSVGFGAHVDDVRPQPQPQMQMQPQAYDSSGMYYSQPISTIQTGSQSYKGSQKYNAPIPTQPLFYYDPASMSVLPIYTNIVPNTYSTAENKPNSAIPTDSNKNGFNLLQILSGGNFYKGTEQADIPQQTAVKDAIVKQESNKLEKAKPLEKVKPLETHDKIKPLMFYLNPEDTPIDLKSFTSSPVQLTYGQQPQVDCNGQTHKAPALKTNKPQPIPLCVDCNPTLTLMGLPSTIQQIQQKKSTINPQVIPIWNGQNASKLNYLIFPNPITK